MIAFGDVALEEFTKKGRGRLKERRRAAVVDDVEAEMPEEISDGGACEEAQVGAIVEAGEGVFEAARERAEAVVPDGVIGNGDDEDGFGESRRRSELSQKGDRVGDMLDDIGEDDGVEALRWSRGEPVVAFAMKDFVAGILGKLDRARVGLDADDVRIGRSLLHRSRIGTAATADIENARGGIVAKDEAAEQLLNRGIRTLDVSVCGVFQIEGKGRGHCPESLLRGGRGALIAWLESTKASVCASVRPRCKPALQLLIAMSRHRTPSSVPALEETNIALTTAIGRPRSLLDVGCGYGLHGAVARQQGAHVVGIEGDPGKAGRARRLLDELIEIDPRDGEKVDTALGARKFDCIVIPDLLEQVDDPDAIVARYARFLEPEGHIVYSVRNREAWNLSLHLKTPGLGYEDDGGKLYSREEAARPAEKAGLDVLRVEQNPMLARMLRPYVDVSRRRREGSIDAIGDMSVYRAYRSLVRPLETMAANQAPRTLAYQHIVVARRPPKPGPLSLTVGMLTMDEEESIERMMEEIRKFAPDAKIVCVDSSMKDQTPVIAERMGAKVLRQLPPRGHGPAMELLMYEAAKESDALIYLDCDFTYPPDVIPQIRRILESGVDVVNASRTRTRPDAMPLPNYIANKTFALAGRVTSGASVSDLHSGMRGYRTSVIRAFSFDGEGDAIPIDTLLWPAKCGYHVVEVPIEYQERVGFSKLRKFTGTVWTFIRLLKTMPVGQRESTRYDVWDRLER